MNAVQSAIIETLKGNQERFVYQVFDKALDRDAATGKYTVTYGRLTKLATKSEIEELVQGGWLAPHPMFNDAYACGPKIPHQHGWMQEQVCKQLDTAPLQTPAEIRIAVARALDIPLTEVQVVDNGILIPEQYKAAYESALMLAASRMKALLQVTPSVDAHSEAA